MAAVLPLLRPVYHRQLKGAISRVPPEHRHSSVIVPQLITVSVSFVAPHMCTHCLSLSLSLSLSHTHTHTHTHTRTQMRQLSSTTVQAVNSVVVRKFGKSPATEIHLVQL
jgi:hypothetical protein